MLRLRLSTIQATNINQVLLMISCLFHSIRKRATKGKILKKIQNFTLIDFKRNLTDNNLIRKCV